MIIILLLSNVIMFADKRAAFSPSVSPNYFRLVGCDQNLRVKKSNFQSRFKFSFTFYTFVFKLFCI